MLGRVLGVLMISDPPERSAGELAEALEASRGSISQTTRSLIQMGLVQRQAKPGERRDYFRVKPGAWGGIMRREMEALGGFRETAERGLALLDSEDPDARRSLEEMRDSQCLLGEGDARRAEAVGGGVADERSQTFSTIHLDQAKFYISLNKKGR